METNSKKIFILEDEIDLNEMIAVELENKGYETYTFYNPVDLIKIFPNEKPDVLITDIRLPEISGFEIIKIVKQVNLFYPSIIAITAYNDVLPQTLYHLGAEAVIYKPFQLQLLTKTIERLCLPIEDRLQLDIEKYKVNTGWVRKLDETKIKEINIGRGGFSISTEEKIETDEIVKFSLRTPDNITITGIGIVRWDIIHPLEISEKPVNKYGIEFVYIDDDSKKYIQMIYNNMVPYIPCDEC